MKKMKLQVLNLGIQDLLSREQMKKVMGGCATGCGNGCNSQFNTIYCRQGGTVVKTVGESSYCGSGWFNYCNGTGADQASSTCVCSHS